MTKKRLTFLLPVLSIVYVLILGVTVEPSQAYVTYTSWLSNSTEFVTSSRLSTAPFPSTTPGLVSTAAARWSQPSTGIPFYITDFNGQIGPVRMGVDGYSFFAQGMPNVPGATSLWTSGGYLSYASVALNADWNWNTVCYFNPTYGWVDVLTITLHEMGHVVSLLHDSSHPEAVMWPDYTCKQTLRTDDWNGVNALY